MEKITLTIAVKHLLTAAAPAKRGAEAASPPLLEKDDEDEEDARDDVQDGQSGRHVGLRGFGAEPLCRGAHDGEE